MRRQVDPKIYYKRDPDADWLSLDVGLSIKEVKKQLKEKKTLIMLISAGDTQRRLARRLISGPNGFRIVWALKFPDGEYWNAESGWR